MLIAVLLLRALFLCLASGILLANAIPALRSRFITYGARASPTSKEERGAAKQHQKQKQSNSTTITTTTKYDALLDRIAGVQVPHAWFWHFYVTSVVCSLFWGWQLYVSHDAAVLRSISFSYPPLDSSSTIISDDAQDAKAIEQASLAWTLMLVQGCRRLYETQTYTKLPRKGKAGQDESQSESKMWIGHWLVGLVFYMAMNMAIWVEALPAFLRLHHPRTHHDYPDHQQQRHHIPPLRLTLLLLLPTNLLFTSIFVGASIVQNRAHKHLSMLRVYTIPLHGVFSYPKLLCPHYTAEIAIYFSLALLAPSQSPLLSDHRGGSAVGGAGSSSSSSTSMVNYTVLCGAAFVLVNLAITASGTLQWYVSRFGQDAILAQQRDGGVGSRRRWWRLVPGIF